MNDDDDLYLTLPDQPEGLMDTMDAIRRLRSEAEEESRRCEYDPQGYTQRRVTAMRSHADKMEAAMERRLGWRRK